MRTDIDRDDDDDERQRDENRARHRPSGAPPWSEITGDPAVRQYLDGEPISCGAALELQNMEWHSDQYGEFTVRLSTWTLVHYEIAWKPAKHAVLHTSVGGHEFTSPLRPHMRFRRPRR